MYPSVHAIGDSHVLHMGGLFRVHHICDEKGQGATAHNLLAECSTTNSKQKVAAILADLDPSSDILLLSFGEVDCRLHLRDEGMVASTVARYTAAIEAIVARGFRVIVHAVIGAVPQDAPGRLSQLSRGTHVLSFNSRLRVWCDSHGVGFLDLPTHDADGLLYADLCDDGVHLNDKALPLYEEWAAGADLGERMDKCVWSSGAMAHFGKIAARALGWPLYIDAPVGDCEVCLVVGMYDPPAYDYSLSMTARAKRRIIQWCGTDAALISRPEMLPEATHFASFDIYRDRVRAVGLPCETLYLPTLAQFDASPLPEEPTVTAYLGSNPRKYGSQIVRALAEAMPDVHFQVYQFGHHDEAGLQRIIDGTTISLQAAGTAGGSTTREMMEAGRIALSTIPMPHSRLVSEDNFPATLIAVREALAEAATQEQVDYWREQNSDEVFAARIEAICNA